MTATAKDLARVAKLVAAELAPLFGRTVVRTTLKLTNMGDGLSKAMAVRPAEYELDEEITFVGRGRVSKITTESVNPDDPDEGVVRVHVVKGHSIVVLDDKAAKRMDKTLRTMDEEWVSQHEAAKGIEKIEGWEDPDAGDDADEPDDDDPPADPGPSDPADAI